MTQLPGQLLNAALSKNIAIQSDIPLKTKRLNFIIASQQLGVDKECICKFLRDHTELEEEFIMHNKTRLSPEELHYRKRGLIQAKLILLILERF